MSRATKIGLVSMAIAALAALAFVKSGTRVPTRSDPKAGEGNTSQSAFSAMTEVQPSPRTPESEPERVAQVQGDHANEAMATNSPDSRPPNPTQGSIGAAGAVWNSFVQPVAGKLVSGSLALADIADLSSALMELASGQGGLEERESLVVLEDDQLGSVAIRYRPNSEGTGDELEIAVKMKSSPGGWRVGDTNGSTMQITFGLGDGQSIHSCRAFLQSEVVRPPTGYGDSPPPNGAALSVTESGSTWRLLQTLVNPGGIAFGPETTVYPGFIDGPEFQQLSASLRRLRPSR